MPQAAPNTEKMDEHLLEVVQALQGAVKRRIPNVKDPKIADKAIQDCKEIFDVIMEGKVSEWLN